MRYRFTKQDGLVAIQLCFTHGINTPIFAKNPEEYTDNMLQEIRLNRFRLKNVRIAKIGVKTFLNRIYGLIFYSP